MNKVTWSIFGAVVVLLLGGLIVYSQQTKTSIDVSNVDASTVLAASAQNGNIADHVFADTKSKVVLVEYGDFQCPGCGAAHPNLKTLLAEYGDKITFVFRNLPLTTIHPNARAAAAAAEAAGLQGKYWEMHDKLYENQANWENLSASRRTDLFKSYAREFGFDEAKFETDIASDTVNNKISFDVALAKKVGASATPSFYLDGKALEDGAAAGILQGDLTEIKKLLDEKLAQ